MPDAEPNWMVSPTIYWVPLLLLLFMWCVVDAKERRIHRPFGWAMFVSLLFPIGVPTYFARTYSARPAIVRISLATLFVTACIAAMWVGNWFAFNYYAVWTNN
jgi:hypothetical protein